MALSARSNAGYTLILPWEIAVDHSPFLTAILLPVNDQQIRTKLLFATMSDSNLIIRMVSEDMRLRSDAIAYILEAGAGKSKDVVS